MGGFILGTNSEQTIHTRYSGNERQGSTFRMGTVVDCNVSAYTADVQLHGHEIIPGVPILNTQGSSLANDAQWLVKLRGSQVALIRMGAQYYILGALPLQAVIPDTEAAAPVTDNAVVSGDPQYTSNSFKTYQNRRPVDYHDSDKVLQTTSGTKLALLNEGVAILKASPMAQFILGKYKDFFKLIARVGSFYSDFGEVDVTHTKDGKVGVHVKGGALYKDETHPDVAKWTIQTWLGNYPENGDARLFVQVNDVDLSQKVTMMFDIKGNLVVEATHDHNVTIGNDETIEISGKQDIHVIKEIQITSDKLLRLNAPIMQFNCE